MNHINYNEALQVLRRAELTTPEIDRLCGFCRKYSASEPDRAAIDWRRLFAVQLSIRRLYKFSRGMSRIYILERKERVNKAPGS